mmetsp:Transcript_25668/g.86265  ORF Transcript_25668/g.86265 Transcript_25668/m.86265 type:complete len:281 (-) Transcript_25668:184-1026(-)
MKPIVEPAGSASKTASAMSRLYSLTERAAHRASTSSTSSLSAHPKACPTAVRTADGCHAPALVSVLFSCAAQSRPASAKSAQSPSTLWQNSSSESASCTATARTGSTTSFHFASPLGEAHRARFKAAFVAPQHAHRAAFFGTTRAIVSCATGIVRSVGALNGPHRPPWQARLQSDTWSGRWPASSPNSRPPHFRAAVAEPRGDAVAVSSARPRQTWSSSPSCTATATVGGEFRETSLDQRAKGFSSSSVVCTSTPPAPLRQNTKRHSAEAHCRIAMPARV